MIADFETSVIECPIEHKVPCQEGNGDVSGEQDSSNLQVFEIRTKEPF